MEKRVSFEKVVKKIGLANAYRMFEGKLPQKEIDKFTFKNWDSIYREVQVDCLGGKNKEVKAALDIIVRKMLEKAESVEELLRVYQKTQDDSPEEKMVLQKLSQLQYPEKWLEIFENDSDLPTYGKAFAYLKDKVAKLVDFS